jgi:hypothetical protein
MPAFVPFYCHKVDGPRRRAQQEDVSCTSFSMVASNGWPMVFGSAALHRNGRHTRLRRIEATFADLACATMASPGSNIRMTFLLSASGKSSI